MTPATATRRGLVDTPVLLLNQNYEPLNVCRVRRAIVLLAKGKAEPLAHHERPLRTPAREVPRPSVIRLRYYVRRPRPTIKLSRREVLVRDAHTCQYCGTDGTDMTIDHVLPRRLGGRRRWDNLVTACRPCNLRKAGRTPSGANMRLRRQPTHPRSPYSHLLGRFITGALDPAWAPYLPVQLRRAS